MNKALIIAITTIGIIVSAQIGFATTTSTGSQTGPTIKVEPSYLSVSQGDTFTVNIVVDPDGNEIAGVDYILHFDSAVLKALNQNPGPFLGGSEMANNIDNSNGSLDYGEWRTDNGVTDPGVLTTIEFEVISTDISELRFERVLLSDPDAKKIKSVAICNGRVGIAQPSTPFMINGYVFNEDESVCNNTTVTITNLNTCRKWVAVSTESSNYYRIMLASPNDVIAGEILRFNAISPDGSMSNTTKHNVTIDDIHTGGFFINITLDRACGDVDNNAIVNILDVRLLLNHITNGYPIDDEWAGDVDGSGTIDMADVQSLLGRVFKT